MQQLEKMLDEWLVKKAPFQLPEDARKSIVQLLPWLTLVGGILMLLGAWGLYQATMVVSQYVGLAAELSVYAGYQAPAVMPLVWVSLILLVVEAVIFFIAFPALKAHKRSGWNLLYWVSLLNVAQSLVQAFGSMNLGSLVMALLGSLVGLYVLFQIRNYYTGDSTTATPSNNGSMKVPKETPPAATK